MNFRLTGVLLALFIILGLAAYWFELRYEPPAPGQGTQTPVFNAAADQVARLEVQSAGKTVTLSRDNAGQWQIVQPETSAADNRRVDDVVTQLVKLTATRTIENASDLASYGLEQPQAQATVTLKQGEPLQLLIGNKTPDGSAYYVRRPDRPTIYIVPSWIISDLTRLVSDPPKPRPTPTPAPPPLATPTTGLQPPPTPTPTVTPASGQ